MTFYEAYTWLKDNDLPNWGVVILTVILVPLAVSWWSGRKVNNISGLQVSFERSPVDMTIGTVRHPAVYIVFSNRTGSVVYLNNPQLRNCSALFPIPSDAARDIGANARPLSFVKPDGGFEGHQITLQTGDQARTGIAVIAAMPGTFYDHRASRLRRIFRRHKYFVLEYTAMVGEKKYSVATIH
jgi:hypothetical protein